MAIHDLRARQRRAASVDGRPLMASLLRRQPDSGVAPAPLDVYLVGTAFSGTTHLGGLLAANFGCFYAGEVGRLPQYVKNYGLFTDPVGCLSCEGQGVTCQVWSPALVNAIEQAPPALAMGRIREETGSALVVDGSKLPAWLQASLNGRDPAANARIVVLLTARSPFSYAMSAMGATGQPLWLALREWRDIYIDAVRTATRTQLPIFVVRNEEVRRDPVTVLDRLAPLFGWPHRITEVAAAEPTHSIGGNAFVQAGFGPEGHSTLARTGLHHEGPTWDAATVEQVTRAASVGSLQRPVDVETARSWAQAAVDCPGLMEIAQTIGYEMYVESERLVAAARGGGPDSG